MRTETLDRLLSAVGEVILASAQLRAAAAAEGVAERAPLASGLDRMERVVAELERRALALRTAPLARVLDQLPRLARDLAQVRGKRVEMAIEGAELELDRASLDRLYDPLVQLVRNAIDHGIETPERRRELGKPEVGRLRLKATRAKDAIRIEFADDGAGIDLAAVRQRAVEQGWIHADLAEDLPPNELAGFVFRPGLSTAASVSEVSGRGVGMDIVRTTLEAMGGAVEVDTDPGQGTRFVLHVPTAASVQRVLLACVADQDVAIPIGRVERVAELPARALERTGRECFVQIEGEPLVVIDLAERLGWGRCARHDPVLVLLCQLGDHRVALQVDVLRGQHDVYVKSPPPLLANLRAVAGVTVLGEGRPVFVLDMGALG